MARQRKVLDDPDWRDYLIRLLENGHTKTAAVRECNISYPTFLSYLRSNPDFKQLVDDTIADRAAAVMSEIMDRSDDDKVRLAAADKIIHHTRSSSTVTEHRHVHELTASPEVAEILALQERLRERSLEDPGIIEGTVLEEEP